MSETDEFELDLGKFMEEDISSKRPELITFYSNFGAGKSWLAASASEVEGLYPVLIIDTEGSTIGTINQFDRARIDVIRPKKQWPGKEYVATKKLLNDLLTKTHKYKTVVIDTYDEVFEWAKKAGEKPGDNFAKWNFVHDELTASGGLTDRLKEAEFLVILNIHEKKDGGDEGSLPFADFQWQGQGKAQLGKYPDMVCYLTRDTNAAGVSTTTLHTQPTKRHNAKNRFGLPAKILNPSMETLYQMIDENNTKETK